jgi:CDP-diacylglycerol--serine O-phosphatidyltransferase
VHTQREDRLRPVDGEIEPRPLIGVALLPSAATLGNLMCGVVAMLCCLLAMRGTPVEPPPDPRFPRLAEFFPTYIAGGAYLIVLAMIFDALDGRLARIARRTSEFGAQLDSIADIVSFGAAPAILLITLLLRVSDASAGTPVSGLEWRIGLLGALAYVGCASIRLARYNAENVRDETAHLKFSGLPAPGAAAGLIALFILHEDFAARGLTLGGLECAAALRPALGVVAFALALLMVSRLDYVHVFNVYLRREHPPTHLVWLLVAAGIAWLSPQVLLVVLAYTYVISGLVLNLGRRRRSGPRTP